MDEEQTKTVNAVATEVFRELLEKYEDELPTEYEEVSLMGSCYGYMLFLEFLGYDMAKVGKEASEGVAKLRKMVSEEDELPDDIYESDTLGFTPHD
jgi:hypothetical protein